MVNNALKATQQSAAAIEQDHDYLNSPQFIEQYLRNMKSQRWRLDNLYTVVNERGISVPFRMRRAQLLTYLNMWYFSIILKTRQPGVTTGFAIFFLDDALFNSNTHVIFISYSKEEMKETFHNKIRYAYEQLPYFIKDANPATKDSETGLRFKNGSSIRVTMSGRGGTFQRVHISEHGKICAKFPAKAREIKTGTLNAVHPGQRVIIESTAEGREGDFYRLCQQAMALELQKRKLGKMDPKFLFFPWFRSELNYLELEAGQTPVIYDYQQKYFKELQKALRINLSPEQLAWYVAKWNIQGDDMKQEHPSTPEEAFEAAIQGTYYANEFKLARAEGRITKVPYQPNHLVDTWWDLGINDETAIWFTQDIGREIHVIDFYKNNGEAFKHYADYLDALKEKDGYRYGKHAAPHDVRARDKYTGKSYLKSAAYQGFKFIVAPKLSLITGINKVREIFRICHFDEEKCHSGLEALEHYRKEWNELLGCYRDHPLHDANSNPADAFRTMATKHDFVSVFAGEAAKDTSTQQHKSKSDARGWT